MRERLTVLIPCKNERLNIRPCIESCLEIADEILIADSGSTDGTMDIAREVGGRRCRIIEREYVHSGDFKNWAIPQAGHQWVLLVDADERITPELAAEIVKTINSGSAADGYWIYRRNHFMGRPVRFCGLQNDCCLRLFRRDVSRYVGDNDHAEVQVSSGQVGKLKSRMMHYTCWSYDQYLRKVERYTKVQSQLWHRNGRQPSYWQLLLRAPVRFIRDYVFQLGFLDGLVGVQYSMLQGYYSFLKESRLWELTRALPQPDPEAGQEAASTLPKSPSRNEAA